MEMRREYFQQIKSLTLQEVKTELQDDVKALIETYKNGIDEMNAALVGKKPTSTPDQSLVSGQDSYLLVSKTNRIQNDVQAIGMYKPSTPVDRFCTRLQNIYEVKVSPDVTQYPELQTEFCRAITLLLPPNAVNKFTTILTWNKFKQALKETYTPKITTFQFLSSCWQFNVANGSTYSEAANKLSSVVHTARDHIKQTFQKEKNKEMTCDDAFEIMGAMILSECIRGRHPGVYNHLIDHLDSCFDPQAVGDKASFYVDRLGDQDQVSSFHGQGALTKSQSKNRADSKAKQTNKNKKDNRTPEQINFERKVANLCKSQGICIKFNLDKPCLKSPCPYEHRKIDVNGAIDFEDAANFADWNANFQ